MDSTALAQPKIIFLHDHATYPLVRGIPLTLGRGPQGPVDHAQHVRLAHRDLAPHHCQVSWDGTAVIFAPLQEEFPCYLNGLPVTQAVSVDHGDILTFGPFNVELDAPSQDIHPQHSDVPEPPPTLDVIPLQHGLTIGCGPSCSVELQHEEFADYPNGALQVLVEESDDGFRVCDRGTEPSWLNGQLFSSEDLIIGDYLQIGSQSLRFDGRALVGVSRTLGGELEASGLRKTYGNTQVLFQTAIHAPAGQFIGILGPSGHGKTTLLKVISGLDPPDSGSVTVNGINLFKHLDEARTLMGYVPQDDIVHGELTVWDALTYSALLRLPDWTSEREIRKLIIRILENLGLYRPDKNIDHTRKRLTELSGGQRKRVSVAVELLNRPQILFLDEPTSGLDPGMEFELMSTLRSLTQSGCTVICTTHVLENVFLMDSVAVIFQGQRVFQGDSTRARSHFEVDRLSEIYTKLEEHRQRWLDTPYPPTPETAPPNPSAAEAPPQPVRKSTLRAVNHLLQRHWKILRSDPKNLLLLFGQPLIVGLLITLAAVDEGGALTKLFLAHVATFWFACSNAAQEIVRERPIFSREKFVGLGVHAYLWSKVIALGTISCLQALILYGVLFLNVHGITSNLHPPSETPLPPLVTALPGSVPWQLAAVLLTALAATAIGLALSAWARRQSQAVLAVPLIIIPQILLAGYVFPLTDWRPDDDETGLGPSVQRAMEALSASTPSGAAQKLMDTSYYWKKEARRMDTETETPYENLQISDWKLRAAAAQPSAAAPAPLPPEETPDPAAPYRLAKGPDPAYTNLHPAALGAGVLLFWCLVSYLLAWAHLRKA